MKNKQGFTLVELLAVIVILAVVMLVAVTSVGPMMEKARKSSLGDEGIAFINGSDEAYKAEGLKGTAAEYTSTESVCYSMKYLCEKGFFEKGCGDDGYTGSVLVKYEEGGKYSYTFWLSNGTYTFTAATKDNYGDIENAGVVYDGTTASEDCGKTLPSDATEEAKTANQAFQNSLTNKNFKECNNGTCTDNKYDGKIISFTINGTTYTSNEGKNWGDWIIDNGGNSSGNSVLWVTTTGHYTDAQLAAMPEYQPGGVWARYRYDTDTYGRRFQLYMVKSSGLPTEEFARWTGSSVEYQTVSSVIQENGIYGGEDYLYDIYCCFDAGTKITMADGTLKNIEDIKVGDVVMSYNIETGKFEPNKVTKTIIKHNSDDLVYVHLSDGTRIGMRAYHPLLTTEGYKSLRPTLAETILEAGQDVEMLKVGDTMVGINGNATITKIEERNPIDNYDTYNFTVENNHNYIAGGIVAHNVPAC